MSELDKRIDDANAGMGYRVPLCGICGQPYQIIKEARGSASPGYMGSGGGATVSVSLRFLRDCTCPEDAIRERMLALGAPVFPSKAMQLERKG